MKSIRERLEALEKAREASMVGAFRVYYKDGSTRVIRPGDGIELCLNQADLIERFEEIEPDKSGNEGVMEGLLNGLLM